VFVTFATKDKHKKEKEVVMVLIPATMVHFDVAAVKESAATRISCGVNMGTQGPKSALYALSDMKSAIDTATADTATAQAALTTYTQSRGAYLKARTALGLALGVWDDSFDVVVALAEKHCVTTDDGTGLGLPTLLEGRTKNPFVSPLGIDLTVNAKTDMLVIHVLKAKGLAMAVTQMSPDPITTTSWTELNGYGLVHRIPMPAPGRYWFQAAHKRAQGTTNFTPAVSILIK
jgi:hypothetical protein